MEAKDVSLAEKVRRRLDTGTLPPEHPAKMSVGFGAGETCCTCDEKIHSARVAYKFDWNEHTYRFHIGCYGLWTAELIRRGRYKPDRPQ